MSNTDNQLRRLADAEERLEQIEHKNNPAPQGDLIITVQTVCSAVREDGERSTAPVLYREEDYITEDHGPAADGRGGRHLVRSPRPGAIPIEPANGNVVAWAGH